MSCPLAVVECVMQLLDDRMTQLPIGQLVIGSSNKYITHSTTANSHLTLRNALLHVAEGFFDPFLDLVNRQPLLMQISRFERHVLADIASGAMLVAEAKQIAFVT